MTRPAAEDGVAVVLAMMTLLLIGAIATALILTASAETRIASHFRDGVEARYAAGAVMARALDLVATLDDWASPIAGLTGSTLVDEGGAGPRTLTDGSTIDLLQVVNLATCHIATACTAADRLAVTADRPWGANNPRWQLFGYGPLSRLLAAPEPLDSPFYAVLLVADDPSGTHRTPAGADAWEGIAVRVEVFGPRGAHHVEEAVAGRRTAASGGEKDYNPGSGAPAMQLLSWREVR